jgi:chitodextrinase
MNYIQTLSRLISKTGTAFALCLLASLFLAHRPMAQQMEAEAWTTQNGLQTEATADVGGGLNVGWIDANDWAEYLNRPLAAGNWKVDARMATMDVNRSIQIFVDDVLKTTLTYPGNTAGWQTWTTVTSAQFNIATGGNHKVRLVFPGNNMNLNWINFVPQVVDGTSPSVPGGLNSPAKTNTTVNLAWTASTDNVGVTGYDVYKGGVLLASIGNVLAYQAVGLTANTAYSFQVRAKDAAGNASALSTALSVTTANVSNLLVNGDFAGGMANWTLYQGANMNVAGEYAVVVPVTANVYDVNVWQKVAMTQGATYTLTFRARSSLTRTIVGGWGLAQAPWTNQSKPFGLTAAWQTFTVTQASTVPSDVSSRVFFDVGGPGGGEVHIDDVVLTTGTVDALAPTVPANLASPSQTNTTINLTWTAATDNVGVTAYEVFKDGVSLAVLGNVTAYQAVGLAQNTAYAFTVRARDAAGNNSAQTAALNVSTANLDLIPPTAPTVTSPSKTSTTVTLGWTGATDNLVVTGYNVFRDGAQIASLADVNSYQAVGLLSGKAYVFTVQAKDAANNVSPFSTPLSVITLDDVPPSAPANLASPAKTHNTVNLTWTAATDNVGVTAYDVLIGGIVFASLGNVTAFQAAGLAPNTAYSFTVRARDAAGNWGANSNALNVSTTNAAANLLINGDFSNAFANWTLYQGVSLNVPGEYAVTTNAGGNVYDVNLWQAVPMTLGVNYTLTFRARSNVNRTIVCGWGFAHDPWTNQNQVVNLTAAWQDFVFTGVSTVPTDANSRVFFDVGGFAGEVHIDNVSLTNAPFVDNLAPSVPAGLTSPAQGETTLNLAWTASTDNVAVTGYEVWVNNALNSTVGNVNAATVIGLVKNTAYSVQVKAFDAAGNKSALSTALAVSTSNGQGPLKIEAEAWTTQNGLLTEATTDVGGGLNVGWIDPNDWAEYANQPLAAGTYKLEVRIAAMDVNRSVQLFVDGALLITVTQPTATGGWQTWATAVSADFAIATGGNHLVRVNFPVNNMNLNWIRFVPQAPDVVPPSVPTALAASGQGGTTIGMTWTASTDVVGVAGYKLFANGILKNTVGPVAAGTLTGLLPSTQYQITVSAFDAAGNESAPSTALAVTTTDGSNLNGIYVLRNRNSGKCVEIAAGSLADGGVAIQNNCDGTRQQKWELVQTAVNVYKLRNVNSNKLLDVKNAGATNDVQQWAEGAGGPGAAQQWRVLPVSGSAGDYTLNPTSGLAKCLEPFGVSQLPGATLHTYGCDNALTSQQFALIATDAVTACVAGAAPGNAIATQEYWAGVPFTQPMELVQEPAAVGNAWIVMDQTGMIRRVNDNPGDNTNTVFLNMQGKLTTAGESGLASLAFDPDYANNRYVYLTYQSSAPMELRLSRWTANPDFKAIDPTSEKRVFVFPQASDIHHSGSIVFGPGPVAGAKYMYLTVGDNGTNAPGDPTPQKVPKMNWPNGKVLRFTPNEYRFIAPVAWNYADGAVNPWIVAKGLRNPWRTSFDGNDLWISNVGFDTNEEINKFNVITDNMPDFGWPWCEGTLCCAGSVNCAGLPAKPADNLLTWPVHEYPRSEGTTAQGAAIAGFVYRGAALPGLVGKFIFSDFVDQTIFALDPVTKVRTTILNGIGDIADIGQDRNGEIMLTDYGKSNVYKIIPGAAQPLVWPPQNLADAGCFLNLNEADAVSPTKPGVNPFTVAQKFWSDGADKQRYISLPPGATVDVANADDWKLPPGGVTIKNFRWPATGKTFETRLFVRHTNGIYAGYTYKWTSATTAALVGANGDTKDLGGHVWNYPSRAQCMTCHNEKVGGSIALETRQLNVANQLSNMSAAGILNPPNPAPLAPFPYHLDAAVPLKERAESYLHVNCANCHRGATESSAGRATWDARFTTPLAQKKACDELPFEAVSGNANERIIKPGSNALSTVWLRAHQRTNNFMPPLGSTLVDTDGVQMLADWMNQLTGCQ